MKTQRILELAGALAQAQVRYLIVGGLAVLNYGYIRATLDVDLVIDLEPANCSRAMAAMAALGFRPRVPVPIEQFADPIRRREWITSKDMLVFTVRRDEQPHALEVDVFISEPFVFADAYAEATWQEHPSGVRLPFVDLGRLLAMKRAASRPKDLLDIAELIKRHPEFG